MSSTDCHVDAAHSDASIHTDPDEGVDKATDLDFVQALIVGDNSSLSQETQIVLKSLEGLTDLKRMPDDSDYEDDDEGSEEDEEEEDVPSARVSSARKRAPTASTVNADDAPTVNADDAPTGNNDDAAPDAGYVVDLAVLESIQLAKDCVNFVVWPRTNRSWSWSWFKQVKIKKDHELLLKDRDAKSWEDLTTNDVVFGCTICYETKHTFLNICFKVPTKGKKHLHTSNHN
jgi:hypothetical protein